MFFILFLLPFTLLVYNYIIYPLFLNPLTALHLPGPFHYKLSKLFILNKFRKEQGNLAIDDLHKKYGPIVQIAPNHVSFNNIEILKKIYLHGNYPKEYSNSSSSFSPDKTGFYSNFGNFGERNLFSTGNSKKHITLKKKLSKLYSKTFVISKQQDIQEKINNVVEVILENRGEPINVYSLFSSMAMDVVSGFEFGYEGDNSTDFIKKSTHTSVGVNGRLESQYNVFQSFRDSSSMWFYVTCLPSLYEIMCKISGLDKSIQLGRDWIWEHLQKCIDNKNKNETNMINSLPESYTLPQIGSEIADHILAGHETTGITLSYICWELSRPSNIYLQQELIKELKENETLFTIENKINYAEIDKLPLLHAIIQEAGRLHAAIPGIEPRFVPSDKQLIINDGAIIIPSGTMVSCQPYSIHRNPKIFDPSGEYHVNSFYPERWLQFENETEAEYQKRIRNMERNMMNFGQGNRMCLGMHLALIEMKACLASIYGTSNNVHSKISPEWCPHIANDSKVAKMGYSDMPINSKASDNYDIYHKLSDVDKMRMADSYTTRPLFDECWLTFK
ncbi:uncharacterized protein SCDLUD_001963 [Saccharomycodes ludwigii]|uniref:uncharacterized protein n=1 Tax=Saccharomycodes ludwigii TaxID=36035 RepID=UPI001E8A554E|nr:hypothetical protein SCDLUD_001963 [Saccharomycodes ludwigii]KAH3902150.1 hypothetical protein SCDLUD_001963 [Saccharomycodes ludwigii]